MTADWTDSDWKEIEFLDPLAAEAIEWLRKKNIHYRPSEDRAHLISGGKAQHFRMAYFDFDDEINGKPTVYVDIRPVESPIQYIIDPRQPYKECKAITTQSDGSLLINSRTGTYLFGTQQYVTMLSLSPQPKEYYEAKKKTEDLTKKLREMDEGGM